MLIFGFLPKAVVVPMVQSHMSAYITCLPGGLHSSTIAELYVIHGEFEMASFVAIAVAFWLSTESAVIIDVYLTENVLGNCLLKMFEGVHILICCTMG